LLERKFERGEDAGLIRLDSKTDEILREGFEAYWESARQRRASRARDLCIDVSVLVLDGHQKLTRRVCSANRRSDRHGTC